MREKPLILIVDDEQNFIDIMSAQLEANGFEVKGTRTGKAALDMIEELNPDLVLLDIHLGGGETGTDIALEIKNNIKIKNIKLTFLSSLKDPWPGLVGDNAKIAKDIGMEDFLTKTDDPKINLEKIKRILGVSP